MSFRSQQRKGDVAQLISQQPSSFKSWQLAEPDLLFANGQRSQDPKTGISLFGPWGIDEGQPLRQIRVGIIGTGETVQAAMHWIDRCRGSIEPPIDSSADPILFPGYPGLEKAGGFAAKIDVPKHLVEVLSPAEIKRCIGQPNRDAAVEVVAQIVGERLRVLADKETRPDVVLVALPTQVRDVAGSGRRPVYKTKKQDSGQFSLMFLEERSAPTQGLSRTLHRAIKAEGMRVGVPVQLSWPTTFSGGPGIEDDATRAWNYAVGLYYKAGGIPWRVTGLARNTCYVGISFFRPIEDAGSLQTSMAQAFSDTGESVVLRGQSFEWDSRRQGEPHLTREHARSLLSDVLTYYKQHLRGSPVRVVIHKSSSFTAEEVGGFEAALPESVSYYDFLSVSPTSIRFLRTGKEPPLRGTVIELAPRRYVLFSSGYIPFLRVYPGLRIPRPLHVAQHYGSGPVTEVLSEVLSLTKLNWNSAAFAMSQPLTLALSKDVGLILSELPREIEPMPSFRFYM